jgi:trehalose 6-phosphate synthase
MRLAFRLNLLLIAGVAAVAMGFAYYQVRSERRGLERDLQRQALDLAESQTKAVEPLLAAHSYRTLQGMVDRFTGRERLAGMMVSDADGHPVAITSGFVARLNGNPPDLQEENAQDAHGEFVRLGGIPMHEAIVPVRAGDAYLGALAIFHDAAYIDTRVADAWRRTLVSVVLQTLLIAAVTLLTVRWGLGKPMQQMAQWLRELRTSSGATVPELPGSGEFDSFTREVSHLASSFTAARAAAEEEARLRETAESQWTKDRLRIFVQGRLGDSRLVVVSNREPYEHFHRTSGIEWTVPASGLVTAQEPILRACDGTWIAQATGDADRESSDEQGRLRVPPDHPQYTLRRVWLTPEEVRGFYLGFANEGLWPLCHIAHTRPTFRADDWKYYEAVNRKFAAAVLKEIRGEENPVVVVQDYHFALMPQLIKLLGADLVGFHIQTHCNNFLETVDRVMESRIERDRNAVMRHGHLTAVRRFPISVAMEPEQNCSAPAKLPYLERAELLAKHGVRSAFMGIGVDRVDYTKGILERFRGLERFFEKHPAYRGEFTFVQIGAPSRSEIARYHDFMIEVQQEADRINRRFQTGEWKPIVLLTRQHSREEILPYYRTADVCMVTSLHDGMNLVAKEYVAARTDGHGVLILSRFAGASHELVDALIVNPYDTEEVASAIHRALEMPPEECLLRMGRMRTVIKEHNIYRWAGNLIAELCEIRTPAPPVRQDAAHAAARS